MADPRVLALALVLDVVWSEPPAAVHPVVWMGRLLEYLERWAPTHSGARLAYGAAVATLVPAAWAVVGALALQRLPWPLQAVVLKPTFAGRALLEAARQVEHALERNELQDARTALRALVSRPTAGLGRELASAAAIESVAENYVDSWLAPLLAYKLGGLPLAYFYRAANTADAMWGYRDQRYEHLGKLAARLDDLLNWVPARLGALLICALSGTPTRSTQVWRSDAGCTASPNAGQSMAAMAGGLGVRLEKLGHYVLHADGRAAQPGDIAAARRLIQRCMIASSVGALLWTASR